MVQLTDLFGSRTILRLLEFFLQNPAGEFSQVETIKKTKLAKATAIIGLRKLGKNSIISVKQIGRTKLYTLRREDYGVTQIKRLFNLASPLIEELIAKVQNRIRKAVVFGSYARGQDREDSDIDVLIIGDISEHELNPIIASLSKKYGRKISPILKTQEQYLAMRTTEPVLWNKAHEGGETIHEA